MARVVVVGGSNLDVKARSAAPLRAATSNPGTVVTAAGGVGRNVAENLARLGTPVALLSAVGRDDAGERLLATTGGAGVDVDAVRRVDEPTGTYSAVLDDDGALVAAVSDMAATATLGPGVADELPALLADAALLVLDGNLSSETLVAAWDAATAIGVPVVLDPVSVAKATALAGPLDGRRSLLVLTPNDDELVALGRTPLELAARGVRHVWRRRGAAGSELTTDGTTVPMPAVPPPAPGVVDVTGAGDAMLAAFCHALLEGADAVDAARFGHAAAAVTVTTTETVRSDLSADLLRTTLEAHRGAQPA